MAQAVPGTTAAFKQVREFRDDIILYMGEPHEDPDIIAEVVDIALNADDLVRGFTIVEVAAQLGAKKNPTLFIPKTYVYGTVGGPSGQHG